MKISVWRQSGGRQRATPVCAVACLLVAVMLGCLEHHALAAEVTIRPLQQHRNEFAGRELSRDFRVEAKRPLQARFVWRLSAKGRTLARGEQNLRAGREPGEASLKFRLAPLRDDVVLPATLSVTVVQDGEELARHDIQLWFFAHNPFHGRVEWLRSLDIHLFDPAGDTEQVFEEAGLPFTALTNPSRIGRLSGGTLIVGAGVSLADRRGLAAMALASAARGIRVLWLSAEEGSLPLEAFASASDLSFADTGIIRRLDKRLDAAAWSGDGTVVASRLCLGAESRDLVARVGDQGWPWLEARWSNSGGHFVYCGCAVVRHWDKSPVPRTMLFRILERLHAEEFLP